MFPLVNLVLIEIRYQGTHGPLFPLIRNWKVVHLMFSKHILPGYIFILCVTTKLVSPYEIFQARLISHHGRCGRHIKIESVNHTGLPSDNEKDAIFIKFWQLKI